jgi:predicted transporter
MFFQPFVFAHIINGILALSAIVYSLTHMDKLRALDTYRITILLLLFSIMAGVHALSHLGLETQYGYFGSKESFVNGVACPCPRRGYGCPCAFGGRCPYFLRAAVDNSAVK